MLKADLDQFLVEFHTLCDFLKVDNIVKCDAHKPKRLDHSLMLQPLTQHGSSFPCELALLKPQI